MVDDTKESITKHAESVFEAALRKFNSSKGGGAKGKGGKSKGKKGKAGGKDEGPPWAWPVGKGALHPKGAHPAGMKAKGGNDQYSGFIGLFPERPRAAGGEGRRWKGPPPVIVLLRDAVVVVGGAVAATTTTNAGAMVER
eukprot:gene26662-65940_t